MEIKRQKINLIILSILLILLPIIIQGSNNSELVQFNEDKGMKRLKTSEVYADILIDDTMTTNTANQGNWTWAVSQPWCTGEGTPEEPYIIKDKTFIYTAGGGECLTIINSRKNFIIGNCTIMNSHPSWSGLILWNVTNGQVLDNDVYNNGGGIVLYKTNDTIISDNNINNSKFLDGIFAQYSHSNTFSGNIVFNSTENGIDLKECNYNTISGNQIFNNTLDGILIELSDFNNLSKNELNNNAENGIYLKQSINNTISENKANNNDHGIFLWTNCYNNTILGNTVYENSDGIHLESSDSNTIIENIANDNDRAGIFLEQSNHNHIRENSARGNIYNGIFLDNENDNNAISENTVNNNKYGIELTYSDFNNITGNTAWDNSYTGIQIEGSNNNTISGNNVNNNTNYGIFIATQCYNNTISENTVKDHKITGVVLEDDSDYNLITQNKMKNNTLGIYLFSDCENNSIYKNFFLENEKHAEDLGTDNIWNSTKIGNYWDNYTETHPNLAIDADDNGIGDVPYNISLSPLIQDHLPIFDNDMPIITIHSPTPGYVFDNIAPSFNVIITDDYLDEMWYTIDGGLHNYSFTENGMINQYAWNGAAEENITLTFYASDKPGNIGTEEVMIAKDYEAPTVNINSPDSGDIFGSTAPSFNVRITDDYLVSMWYTIDLGVHNYTFTTNSTINQTAWDAMSDGAITLRFYANDTLGHIGSAGVNIIKDTVAPVIIINSPVEGDKFGKNVPLFNITVIEDNLDVLWYSFDGGTTMGSITDNIIFVQRAWDAVAKGNVTITFYARDFAGNEVTEEVSVIKSVTSGLDPGVIIIIVVVSVIGGVAVISVVYIFMKKRMTPA